MSTAYELCRCAEKPTYQQMHHCPGCQVEAYGCGPCWLCDGPTVPGGIAVRCSTTGIAETEVAG